MTRRGQTTAALVAVLVVLVGFGCWWLCAGFRSDDAHSAPAPAPASTVTWSVVPIPPQLVGHYVVDAAAGTCLPTRFGSDVPVCLLGWRPVDESPVPIEVPR